MNWTFDVARLSSQTDTFLVSRARIGRVPVYLARGYPDIKGGKEQNLVSFEREDPRGC